MRGRARVALFAVLLATVPVAGGAQVAPARAVGDPAATGGAGTVTDTARARPNAADTTAHPARPDTAVTVDPLLAWTAWPAIGPAIALAPLDGPTDILEKQEIIADRLDDLAAEGAHLDSLAATWQDRGLALTAQLEVLDDLAGLQVDADLEFQQRLDAVRQDLLEAKAFAARIEAAQLRLHQRLTELRALSLDYRRRATALRAREERR